MKKTNYFVPLAKILDLDIKAQLARDTVAGMRSHDRSLTESIRIIKENVARWEEKHQKQAKDEDIVPIMLQMAFIELVQSKAPPKTPWATDVILHDAERLVRCIRRYLPEPLPRDELHEAVKTAWAELPDEQTKTDLLHATQSITLSLRGYALPREVLAELEQIAPKQ